MYEDLAPKLANLLTTYCYDVKAGDKVLILGNPSCLPMVYSLAEAVIRKGGHPMPVMQLPYVSDLMMRLGNDDQLSFENPIFQTAAETIDMVYNVMSSQNTRANSRVEGRKARLLAQAGRSFIETFGARRAANEVFGCIFAYPENASAQEADRSLIDWTEFIYRACGLHTDDPVAFWQGVHDEQEKLVNYFNGKSKLHMVGSGIDLTMDMTGRTWINSDGKGNMPSGEIFSAPIESSVNGYVQFNMRNVRSGREMTGIKLKFEDGKVVEASAAKNEDYLLSQLDVDEGARFLGEIAIGTNYNISEISGNILFDEKIGGTIHMALGRSIHGTGGENQSQVHWDIIHDMHDGEIYLDDELVYKNGQFTINTD